MAFQEHFTGLMEGFKGLRGFQGNTYQRVSGVSGGTHETQGRFKNAPQDRVKGVSRGTRRSQARFRVDSEISGAFKGVSGWF